jgi:hypothetical protein
MHSPVNAGHDQGVSKPRIIVARRPLPEVQSKASELAPHVRDQARRRQIKHAKPRRLVEQMLDQQACFNRLPQTYLVSNENPSKLLGFEYMLHQAYLMRESIDRSGVETTERVFG